MDEKKTGSHYYDLWHFFAQEHNLILLDSDIQEIIHRVSRFQDKNIIRDTDIDNCAIKWEQDLDAIDLPEEQHHKVAAIMKSMVSIFKNKCRVLLRLIFALEGVGRKNDNHENY